MLTKPESQLTLRDKLSRLNHVEACSLLGSDGPWLIQLGGRAEIDIANQVRMSDERFVLKLPQAVVGIWLDPRKRRRLRFECTSCGIACEHLGAAFSLILEEKSTLGLATPPPEEPLPPARDEAGVVRQALEERMERSRTEAMKIQPVDPRKLWTDYVVTSAVSGKTYRVALRGWEPGQSYCTCPDYRKNTLGTCKHVLRVAAVMKTRFPASARKLPYKPERVAVHLRYAGEIELHLSAPESLEREVDRLLSPFRKGPIADVKALLDTVRRLERLGTEVTIFPDAQEHIDRILHRERIRGLVSEIRRNPARHPLRTTLLKTELLPYQLDGIAFALGAGRAILADDMGLGKTIQGIGLAEMLGKEAGAERVLIICPASLKSQWREEILRFSTRPCRLILGALADRARQYEDGPFFTICNYEQVLRDIGHIERVKWDLIVLDEGQRIKNWEAKTTRVLKGLRSRFALVLTGTPLENRLEDLFSVAEFVDERRLGPAFRFFHRHRRLDEKGKILGYEKLSDLRARLEPILLRRTRVSVMQELPKRTTEIRRIPPTQEQRDIDAAQMMVVASIVRKSYFTEMDLLRLQKALLLARMASDSTYLVDKKAPGYSSKLEELSHLLEQLSREKDRKIILFSEWTTMLDMIEERILRPLKIRSVRLDGSVPQKKRQVLVHEFQNDPRCTLFLATNAGSTGLNLQAADTVINVDLPWNPAVLEQRISRAHRMGQKRPVQVYILVTEGCIEEKLLATLSAKHALAQAALDIDSKVDSLDVASGMAQLKSRLEVLLGAAPEAPVDESVKADQRAEAEALERKKKVAAAGGQLFSAACSFFSAMLPPKSETEESRGTALALRRSLEDCIEKDAEGRLQLTVTLPDAAALDSLARAVAVLLGAGAGGGGSAETLQFPVPPAPGAEREVSPLRAIGAGAGRN